MWGRKSRRARPPRSPERPARVQVPFPPEEVFIGGTHSPFSEDEAERIKRNEAAAALVDENTMAYVVVRLRKNNLRPSGEVVVAGHVRPEWRNHFRAVFERIAHHGFS